MADTPPTGEIDDCFVTVDGNSASSDESPDSGWDTYQGYKCLIFKTLLYMKDNIYILEFLEL